jgi:hypothetical protein
MASRKLEFTNRASSGCIRSEVRMIPKNDENMSEIGKRYRLWLSNAQSDFQTTLKAARDKDIALSDLRDAFEEAAQRVYDGDYVRAR